MADITITVEGIDKVAAALHKFPTEIAGYVEKAGNEAANRVILKQKGLRKYPPATSANQPPTPYYIRGRGTQTAHGNLNNSERLGTQFYTEAQGYITAIGNRASYAPFVVGEEQARAMGAKGWRRMYDVANEQISNITKVYQAWINKAIKDLGLG